MKLSPRIIIPILLATMLAGGTAAFFLWQIKRSVETIESIDGMSLQDQGWDSDHLDITDRPIASQSLVLTTLRQGEILARRGQLADAEQRFTESVEAGGGQAALTRLFAIQVQRRNFDHAADTLRALKRLDPLDDTVIMAEGMLALSRGLPEEALRVLKRGEGKPLPLLGEAYVAIMEGRHEDALTLLQNVRKSSDPDARSKARIIEQAYEEFALFPDGQDIHRQTLLARALAENEQCFLSLRLLDPVLSAASRYRDAWIVRGFCELMTDEPKAALTALEQAYTLDPSKPETQYFLARTHAMLGDPQNAVTYLQYAIINGFEPVRDARALLAEYALELGNIDLALEERKLLADSGTLADVRAFAELAISLPQHVVAGFQSAESAAKRWPEDAGAQALAAKAALAAGLPAEAERFALQALAIDPRNPEALKVQVALSK